MKAIDLPDRIQELLDDPLVASVELVGDDGTVAIEPSGSMTVVRVRAGSTTATCTAERVRLSLVGRKGRVAVIWDGGSMAFGPVRTVRTAYQKPKEIPVERGSPPNRFIKVICMSLTHICDYKGYEIWRTGWLTETTRYVFGRAYRATAHVYTYNKDDGTQERGSLARRATSVSDAKKSIDEALFWETEDGKRMLELGCDDDYVYEYPDEEDLQ